jgi:SAM-dependent methyltransferase
MLLDDDHLASRADLLSTLDTLRDERDALENRSMHWRQLVGELACRNGRSALLNGAFCLDLRSLKDPHRKQRLSAGVNDCLSPGVSRELAKVFANQSVLDLGCGLGQYGEYFNANGQNIRWVGVDGASGVDVAAAVWKNTSVISHDLANGLPGRLRHPWDWTMSIEVCVRASHPSWITTSWPT